MSQIEQIMRENRILRLVRQSNRCGSHLNCVRLFRNNTGRHEYVKVKVCMELLKRGHNFITEAIFENNKRADVLDVSSGIIYEILSSETKSECLEKVKAYPSELEVRTVDANIPFNPKLLD